MSSRVLGIDPGTAVTGYGVVEPAPTLGCPGRLVECGIIRTDPRQPIWSRLEVLYDGVSELIARHRPTAVAIESVFYGKNARSTLTLGHARGVILLAAARAGLEIAEFPPATVKKSVVGGGGAAKAQVAYMVQQLLRLKRPPAPSDAADGVAVALTYLINRPQGPQRPERRQGPQARQKRRINHRSRL
ncbi:MAG: crossover junction endodeoxyribonuclease RuvC [Gemmatimonadetes bacterium]|nr:crossover junction endodeoxyribonuclease RuvC [Gemmatimonadota bacterium]MBI3082056.1 crossover junction endodeoxyribonuclease RuvC [Gemmatimonadota bacterium]